MANTSAPSDRWPPINFLRHALLTIVCFIVSAAAFVSAIFLYTYCIPVVEGGQTTGCVFPHLFAADLFVFGGVLFLALGLLYGVWAELDLEPRGWPKWAEYDYGPSLRSKTPPSSTPEAPGQSRSP